jgi:serine/threonine protein phosphatase PrpC
MARPMPLDAAACPSCGRLLEPQDKFCEACGARLAQPAPNNSNGSNGSVRQIAAGCPFCSSPNVSADGYCESCGRRLPSKRDSTEFDLGLVAGVSDRGLRHRRNEDAMALAATELNTGPAAVAVVCDGVSGSPNADAAARAAARALARRLMAGLRGGEDPVRACSAASESAREELVSLALTRHVSADDAPATTFVAATLTRRAITLCWLGDSRAYWLSAAPRSALRLTRDDSVAADMVDAGQATEAAALGMPQAHMLTRWVGADIREAPNIAVFEPPGPGALLLCSDGLWNYRPDAAELARLALPAALTDPLSAASMLIGFALTAGGMDNVTAVLAPSPLAWTLGTEPGDVAWRLPADPIARRARP